MRGLGRSFTDRMPRELGPVGHEFQRTHAAMGTWVQQEHKSDGTHGDITALSAVVAGLMNFGGPWELPEGTSGQYILTPPQLTANQNDYRPQYIDTALVLRLSTDASTRELTGIYQYDVHTWRRIVLINVGSFNLVVPHNDAGSTSRYRIACPGAVDYTIHEGGSVEMLYDANAANWRLLEVNQLTLALLNSVGVLRASNFKHEVIAGGSAGNHTVSGITTTNDTLIEVLYFVGAGTDVTDIEDITAEFTVTGANTINNAGGTDTTGGKLRVLWADL